MAKREYRASGRYGYWAIDEFWEGDSGRHGDPLIFRTKKLAEEVANRLNEAYAAGIKDTTNEHSG